jgi:hypothetical protein
MSATSHWHCALCGTPARAPFRAPQPDVAPDLDLRPGEPARAMLQDWLQRCSSCAALAPDVSTLSPAAKHVVRSAAYQTLLTSVSEETLPFRRWVMICRSTGEDGRRNRHRPAEIRPLLPGGRGCYNFTLTPATTVGPGVW